MSPSDPAAAWTTRGRHKVQFAYSVNHLVDLLDGVIVDVAATPTRISMEVDVVETMLDRVEARFDLKPERITADIAYGTGELLGEIVARNIAPHIPVWDKGKRDNGTPLTRGLQVRVRPRSLHLPSRATLSKPPARCMTAGPFLAGCRQRLGIALDHRLERLRVPPLRMLSRLRLDPIDREGELETDRPLGPQRAVVVEGGDDQDAIRTLPATRGQNPFRQGHLRRPALADLAQIRPAGSGHAAQATHEVHPLARAEGLELGAVGQRRVLRKAPAQQDAPVPRHAPPD
jgi:hypothetical protein